MVAEQAIAWYARAQVSKRFGARALRLGAIVLAAVAGVLPIMAQIFNDGGRPLFPPAWASVVLATAGALVILDRFFGFSSAWMRFISAELRIRHLLEQFRIDWETERAGWKGQTPSEERVHDTLATFKAFVTEVNSIVLDETKTWIAEFQTTLSQIDDAAKAKATVTELGAIDAVVTNGDQCEAGWTLSVDGSIIRAGIGKSMAVGDILPGLHAIQVSGVIGQKNRRAEASAQVKPASITRVEVTLS